MMAGSHNRLRFSTYCALALFGFSLLLIGLGSSRVLTYHEMVFAQPARETGGSRGVVRNDLSGFQ